MKRKTSAALIISLFGLSVFIQSCGGGETTESPQNEQQQEVLAKPPDQPAKTAENNIGSIDVGTGNGNLSGVVQFTGNVPKAQKFQVAKDPNTCGSGTREIQEVNVDAGGGLIGAVVYLESVEGGKGFDDPVDGYLLNQEGCRFVPHLLVVRKGADVSIVNSDPVLHNIHTYQIIGRVRRSMFNIAQPEQYQKITKTIDPSNSNVIKVECDAHNFMHAWIFTAENPYYAVTDASGSFSITDIPAGKYTIKVWNPTLETAEQQVAVVGGQENSINISIKKS